MVLPQIRNIRVEINGKKSFADIISSELTNIVVGWYKSHVFRAVELFAQEQINQEITKINKYLDVDQTKLLSLSNFIDKILQEYSHETYAFDFTVTGLFLKWIFG